MTVYSPSGYNVDDFIQNPYHASSKRAQEQQEALERGIQLGMKLGIQMAQGQGDAIPRRPQSARPGGRGGRSHRGQKLSVQSPRHRQGGMRDHQQARADDDDEDEDEDEEEEEEDADSDSESESGSGEEGSEVEESGDESGEEDDEEEYPSGFGKFGRYTGGKDKDDDGGYYHDDDDNNHNENGRYYEQKRQRPRQRQRPASARPSGRVRRGRRPNHTHRGDDVSDHYYTLSDDEEEEHMDPSSLIRKLRLEDDPDYFNHTHPPAHALSAHGARRNTAARKITTTKKKKKKKKKKKSRKKGLVRRRRSRMERRRQARFLRLSQPKELLWIQEAETILRKERKDKRKQKEANRQKIEAFEARNEYAIQQYQAQKKKKKKFSRKVYTFKPIISEAAQWIDNGGEDVVDRLMKFKEQKQRTLAYRRKRQQEKLKFKPEIQVEESNDAPIWDRMEKDIEYRLNMKKRRSEKKLDPHFTFAPEIKHTGLETYNGKFMERLETDVMLRRDRQDSLMKNAAPYSFKPSITKYRSQKKKQEPFLDRMLDDIDVRRHTQRIKDTKPLIAAAPQVPITAYNKRYFKAQDSFDQRMQKDISDRGAKRMMYRKQKAAKEQSHSFSPETHWQWKNSQGQTVEDKKAHYNSSTFVNRMMKSAGKKNKNKK